MTREEIINQYTLLPNNSKIYYNGSVWQNNEGLKFSIIGHTNRKQGKDYPYFLCEFEDSTILEVSSKHIQDGQIKNPNHPSLYGVGYFGIGSHQATKNYKKTKEYQLWCRILGCCYNPKDKSYKYYGAKGVTVDERWHNFQQFCNDICELSGYEEWVTSDLKYALDKDILCDQHNISPKIYSKDTCQFIEIVKNNSLSGKRLTGKTYIGTRISDNYQEEFTNIAEFSRKYGLYSQSVNRCINNKLQKTQGWTFKIKF